MTDENIKLNSQFGLGTVLRILREKKGLSIKQLWGWISDSSEHSASQIHELELGNAGLWGPALTREILHALDATKRDRDIAIWLLTNEADPKLVEFVMSYPQITSEAFFSAAGDQRVKKSARS